MRNLEIKTQNGRSMIEMLGVLAIIGVLSVGGIAGYSKAMQKYRINKTIEQITLIAGNLRAFFKGNYIESYCYGCTKNGCNGFTGIENGRVKYEPNGCPIIKKAKIFPDEMLTFDSSTGAKITGISGAFGLGVRLTYANKSSSNDGKAFRVEYDIPTDEEVCIELFSKDWSDAGVKGIYIGGGGPTYYAKVPVDIDTAVSYCSSYISAVKSWNGSSFSIYFYFDVDDKCWKSGANISGGNVCS
ncbi:MAG: hypothetical protein IKO06_05070 [Alphaproteobacteria bacterium]|nr:hypothetical protein [Alphaproteobacteria bacterium]